MGKSRNTLHYNCTTLTDSIFRKDGTAQGVAKQRFIESLATPNQRIIYDPCAAAFVVGSSIIRLMGHKLNLWLTQKLAPGFHEHLMARTRFIDELIETSTANGVTQYVILGAGYDLRAHRLQLPSALHIFEVDQPEVQRRKRSKLPKDIHTPVNLNYVGLDFNHQTLKAQLLEAGFDPNTPSIFTLEGVSQYITKTALRATLEDLADLTKHTKATLCISYADEQLFQNPKACFGKGYPNAKQKADRITSFSAKVGEPWISLYTNKEMQDLCFQYGFLVVDHKVLADLNAAYFTPVGRTIPEAHLCNLEHFLVVKSAED